MIITALLPDRAAYILVRSDERGYLYQDRRCDRFLILISDPSMWSEPHQIHIGERKGKSNAAVYLQKVQFKALHRDYAISHRIIREEYKALLSHSYNAAFAYAAPIGNSLWMSYCVESLSSN